MKFSGKKVVALVIALMMCSTMVTAFATETTPSITITSVKILNSATDEGTECVSDGAVGTVSLTPEQLLQVTATVANVEDAQISFMSYTAPVGEAAATYTDATIQYLDQKAASGNEATFTFRPRIDDNTFVAMTGATSVTAAAQFNYTVTAADVDMTVTGSVSYPSNEIVDTALVITGVIEEIASVKIGETTLTTDQYTVVTDAEANTTTITINAAAIPTTMGTYTVTISADGYNDGTATISITAATTPIPEESLEEAQGQVNNAADALDTSTEEADGTFSVNIAPQNVTVGEEEKTITFTTKSVGAGVTEENGKLVFDPSAENAPFVGKATVEVMMASNAKVTKEVYIIPSDVTISYGNVTALTSNGTDDAFAITGVQETDDANFKAWVEAEENLADVNAAKAKALAIGAGRADVDTIAAVEDTLDFNRRDGISLNEYNIYRKMIGCFEGYGITNVNAQREALYPVSSN